MNAELHQRAGQSAACQPGVLSRPQLLSIGFTDSTIRSYLSNRRFSQLARGAYNTVTGSPSYSALLWAAQLRCGSLSFLFGASALHFWGYKPWSGSSAAITLSPADFRTQVMIEMAVPKRVHNAVAESWIQVVRVDGPRELNTVAELRIESRADALIDSVRHLRSDQKVEDPISSAVQNRIVSLADLQAAAARRKFPRRATVLSTVELLGDGQTTPLEMKGKRNIVAAHGLPAARELARVLILRGWQGQPTTCRRKNCNVLINL